MLRAKPSQEMLRTFVCASLCNISTRIVFLEQCTKILATHFSKLQPLNSKGRDNCSSKSQIATCSKTLRFKSQCSRTQTQANECMIKAHSVSLPSRTHMRAHSPNLYRCGVNVFLWSFSCFRHPAQELRCKGLPETHIPKSTLFKSAKASETQPLAL